MAIVFIGREKRIKIQECQYIGLKRSGRKATKKKIYHNPSFWATLKVIREKMPF